MLKIAYALLCAGLFIPIPMAAQTPAGASNPAVPTTKILAIGHLTAAPTAHMRQTIMPGEVRDTVKLYLAGKIDQWYVRQDQNGVVFVMNVHTVEEARQLLGDLPLGKAKLMEFELIPLGPLNPLRILLHDGAAATNHR